MRIYLQLLALSYWLMAWWVTPSFAQSYPSRHIELVSATGAGGGSDLVARMVADKFQTLGAIGFDLNSISVAGDSTYRTLKDLLAAARDKPKTISVGITSPGGGAHSMMYRLERLSGARFNMVSFKSGAESVTAVMGGHIQPTAENLGKVMGQVAELSKWLASQQVEMTQFLTEMGLALKK